MMRMCVSVQPLPSAASKPESKGPYRNSSRWRLKGKTRIAADMTKVSFLDSIILGTLVWGMKKMRDAGGDWRLFGLHAFVRRLFDITQLDKAFQLFDDEESAVSSYDP